MRAETWVRTGDVVLAGVPGDQVIYRMRRGEWGWRDRAAVREVRLSDLPKKLQTKVLAVQAERERRRKLSDAQQLKELQAALGLDQIKPEQRGKVAALLDLCMQDRITLLERWRAQDEFDGEGLHHGDEPALFSRAWVAVADGLHELYPTLSVFPLPRELDRLAQEFVEAESHYEKWVVLLGLDSLQGPAKQAVEHLRANA